MAPRTKRQRLNIAVEQDKNHALPSSDVASRLTLRWVGRQRNAGDARQRKTTRRRASNCDERLTSVIARHACAYTQLLETTISAVCLYTVVARAPIHQLGYRSTVPGDHRCLRALDSGPPTHRHCSLDRYFHSTTCHLHTHRRRQRQPTLYIGLRVITDAEQSRTNIRRAYFVHTSVAVWLSW